MCYRLNNTKSQVFFCGRLDLLGTLRDFDTVRSEGLRTLFLEFAEVPFSFAKAFAKISFTKDKDALAKDGKIRFLIAKILNLFLWSTPTFMLMLSYCYNYFYF